MKGARQSVDTSAKPSHPVRLPGFLNEQDIGLGDVIRRATSYVGIQACGGCARRAGALNRWFVFSAGHFRKRGVY